MDGLFDARDRQARNYRLRIQALCRRVEKQKERIAGLRAACEENQKMREVERLLHDTIADLRENNDRLCERIVELGARVYAYSLYLQAACKECDGEDYRWWE